MMRDAKDDGRKVIEILREHYVGKGKPRGIALYTELTSLKMSEACGLTDYVLKAETTATSLKSAGEEISDSLLTSGHGIEGLTNAIQHVQNCCYTEGA